MRRGLTVFGFLLVLAVGSCWLAYPSGALRYKMTVEVEVDGEIYSGSAVHEIRIAKHPPPNLAWDRNFSTTFRGEAVVVDIGSRGTLFVLLTGPCLYAERPLSEIRRCRPDPEDVARKVFNFPETSDAFVRSMRRIEAEANVEWNDLPMFVVFADLSAPETVQLVDPMDLAASFGEDVNLLRVHLQTTKRQVTTGITDTVVWINEIEGRGLDGSRSRSANFILANTLHTGHLSREVLE